MKYYNVCLQCLPANHWFHLLHTCLLVQKKKRAEENYSDIPALYSCTSTAIRTKQEFFPQNISVKKLQLLGLSFLHTWHHQPLWFQLTPPGSFSDCMGKLSTREFQPYCLFQAPLQKDPGKQQVFCFLPYSVFCKQKNCIKSLPNFVFLFSASPHKVLNMG